MYYILLLIGILYIQALHLNPSQNKLLLKLLKNKKLPEKHKLKLNIILYKSYEKWAIKQAIDFKQKNPFKCSKISQDELNLYAKMGLYQSIKNYNSDYYFNIYSRIYIQSELKKALTEAYSFSILPKKIRMSNKSNMTETEREKYNELLFTEFRSDTSYWYKKDNTNHKNIHNLDEYREIWNKIHKINDTFTKRIIFLKYDYEFNQIRSNKRISELMCCSSEYVRKKIQDFKLNE